MLTLLPALLAACTYIPQQATSIEDYCNGVFQEAVQFADARATGVRAEDIRAHIGFNLAPYYPKREVKKMLEVVDMVYAGTTPDAIRATCIAERTAGTWFKVPA